MTRFRGTSAMAVVFAALACGKDDPSQTPGSSTGGDETTTTATSSGSTDEHPGSSSSSSSSSTGDIESTSGESSSTTGEGACEIDGPQECTQPGWDGPGECDPYQQDCPAGEKCLPFDPDAVGIWDSTHCTPIVDDAAALGEPCTMTAGSATGGEDTCGAGLVCWDLVGDQGTCVELCGCGSESPTCEGAGTLCAVLNAGAVGVCRPACIPTDIEACEANQVCALTGSNAYQCVNANDNAGVGEGCDAINACEAGLACVPSSDCGDIGCCVAFCDVDDPATCEGTCSAVFISGAPHECYDAVGYCDVP